MTNTNISSSAYVLYVDHQGHPAPLTECYHATASRNLSSVVPRYPPSCTENIDSGYCPQCLSYYDSVNTKQLGYCPKPTCQQCPYCLVAVSITTAQAAEGDVTECFYKCGLCSWTSKDCNLKVILNTKDVGKVEIVRAAEDLGTALSECRLNEQKAINSLHKNVIQQWKEYNKHNKKRKDDGIMRKRNTKKDIGWSIELLEKKVEQNMVQNNIDFTLPEIDGKQMRRISIQDIIKEEESTTTTTSDDPTTEIQRNDLPIFVSQLQSNSGDGEPLPLPIPLALRKSLRCRAELEQGRPGILLKPKLNPLDGDSSVPNGQGQWFRKDSSAIYVIPRIQIVKQVVGQEGNEAMGVVFLLKVSNPTLGPVRLRLTKSTYEGEIDYWANGIDDDDEEGNQQTTTIFNHLLVDALSQTHMDVNLKYYLTSSLETTETIELVSAEDSIIEFGAKSRETPEAVLQWNPELSASNETYLRLVAKSASDAWFELFVRDEFSKTAQDNRSAAVPIALEIELGKGSWEASLIPLREGVEKDKVVFNMIVVWDCHK